MESKAYFEPKKSIMGINVTPIIDVALVLVIILMITTPIMTISDLSVSLPRAHVRSAEEGERVNITVNPTGQVAVDRTIIAREDLVGTLSHRLQEPGHQDLMVVVRADGAVAHQTVRGVLQEARQAGARRLAIATTRAGGREDQELAWTP
jgi:biopolymer transport protein ExbD